MVTSCPFASPFQGHIADPTLRRGALYSFMYFLEFLESKGEAGAGGGWGRLGEPSSHLLRPCGQDRAVGPLDRAEPSPCAWAVGWGGAPGTPRPPCSSSALGCGAGDPDGEGRDEVPCPGVPPCPALSGGSRRWRQVRGTARPHLANRSFPLASAEEPQPRRGSPEAKAKDALSTVETPAWPKQGWEGSEASETETIRGGWEEQGQSPPWPDPSAVMSLGRMDPTLAGPLAAVMDT